MSAMTFTPVGARGWSKAIWVAVMVLFVSGLGSAYADVKSDLQAGPPRCPEDPVDEGPVDAEANEEDTDKGSSIWEAFLKLVLADRDAK